MKEYLRDDIFWCPGCQCYHDIGTEEKIEVFDLVIPVIIKNENSINENDLAETIKEACKSLALSRDFSRDMDEFFDAWLNRKKSITVEKGFSSLVRESRKK